MFETGFFSNQETANTKYERFSPENVTQFFKNFNQVIHAWGCYLQSYTRNSAEIFGGEPELPWRVFDERTWVSSLAVAISKDRERFPEAILVEELPVKKDGNQSTTGNADLWCCLDIKNKFSFYLEAKSSPWAKEKINDLNSDKQSLRDIGKQMASAGWHGLFSQTFRDYQKSAGTSKILSRSPHHKQDRRKHDHLFVSLLVRPIVWNDEKWDSQIRFESIFAAEHSLISVHKKGEMLTEKDLHNVPITGLVMREKEKNSGFIAMVLMLGESINNTEEAENDSE